MVEKALKTGPAIEPRFEFRSFGHSFADEAERMVEFADPVPVRERRSDEIYIVSKSNNINNIKIRYDLMDIKTLVQTVDGLEQWTPLMKAGFPIRTAILANEVFPAFQVEPSEFVQTEYTLDAFLELVSAYSQLQAVNVSKHRLGYLVNGVMCEAAEVTVDGDLVRTVAVESTDIEAVKRTIVELGLDGIENINYIQAIKRMIGMIDRPLAN